MVRPERRSPRRRSIGRSGFYLVFCATAVLVAMIGVGLLLVDGHDGLGRVLLIGGDAAAVAGFVLYVRRRG